jgi:hypothetical protein
MPGHVADRVIAFVALRACSDPSTWCVLLGEGESDELSKRAETGPASCVRG